MVTDFLNDICSTSIVTNGIDLRGFEFVQREVSKVLNGCSFHYEPEQSLNAEKLSPVRKNLKDKEARLEYETMSSSYLPSPPLKRLAANCGEDSSANFITPPRTIPVTESTYETPKAVAGSTGTSSCTTVESYLSDRANDEHEHSVPFKSTKGSYEAWFASMDETCHITRIGHDSTNHIPSCAVGQVMGKLDADDSTATSFVSDRLSRFFAWMIDWQKRREETNCSDKNWVDIWQSISRELKLTTSLDTPSPYILKLRECCEYSVSIKDEIANRDAKDGKKHPQVQRNEDAAFTMMHKLMMVVDVEGDLKLTFRILTLCECFRVATKFKQVTKQLSLAVVDSCCYYLHLNRRRETIFSRSAVRSPKEDL
jgi:hypothetical protein